MVNNVKTSKMLDQPFVQSSISGYNYYYLHSFFRILSTEDVRTIVDPVEESKFKIDKLKEINDFLVILSLDLKSFQETYKKLHGLDLDEIARTSNEVVERKPKKRVKSAAKPAAKLSVS